MGLEEEIANARLDVAEMKCLLDGSKRPKVQSELSILLRRLETTLANLLDKQASSGTETKVAQPTSVKENGARPAYDVPFKNYSWDQSDKYVKFYLTGLNGVKELDNENLVPDFTQTSAKLKVCNLAGKNHIFEIIQLPHKILPDKSHFKVKSDMVTVFLAKADEGKSWSHATAAAKAQADKKSASMAKMTDSPDTSKDPQAGLMDMMKKMYDEGDDEMKRTIAKAWTEGQDKKAGGMGGMMGGMGGLDDL